MAGAILSGKAFVAVDDLTTSGSNSAGSKIGGRVDIRKEINEINVVASLTDSTVRGYESAPWLSDAIVTADKQINSNTGLALGYDFGVKGAFATVTGTSNVSNKPVKGSATWFQRGNHIRTEASVELDGRSSLWGTYTFNDNANLVNSTYINLKEREGFILRPFTVPIATSAVKYTMERDGNLIEASADLNKQAPYLSVQRGHKNGTVKASYAFKEEYALVEVGYSRIQGDIPIVKGYFKGPLGRSGVGPLSMGLIFDKTIDL